MSSKIMYYFKRLFDSPGTQRKDFEKKKVIISEKAQETSYSIAELVAQQMKNHTTAESLII
jgi:hypothetical protein